MKHLLLFALLTGQIAAAVPSSCDIPRLQELLKQGQLELAENQVEVCRKAHPNDPEVFFATGLLAMAQNRPGKASDAFKQAVDHMPENGIYHLWLGRAYGELAGQSGVIKQAMLAGKIKGAFEKAVQLDPENTEARFDLMMFYLIAPGIAGGDKDKALTLIEWLDKNDPLRGYEGRFILAARSDNLDQAIANCRQAAKLDPENPDWPLRIGGMLMKQENLKIAREHWHTAAAHFPENPTIRYQLGKTLLLLDQDLETAAACFSHCASLTEGIDQETRCWSHYRLGEVLEKLNRLSEARQSYEGALKINPEMKEARRALKRLPGKD